uniref:Uncharacterized protein n=1 Tax=Glossina palpalis gambiensis TaxID=67801 RepID=A0A1B0BFC9_9MUSC
MLDITYNVDKPSTSREAPLIQQVEQLKAENSALKRSRGQEVEAAAESGVSDIEALKEVVRKLTPHVKIMHFEEVYTNKATVDNQAEDRILGCALTPKGRNTMEYVSILIFDARSLLPVFNIMQRAEPKADHKGDANQLEANLELAEEIGLDVRAVICDKLLGNKETTKKIANGVYDYVHILESF